MLSAGAHRLFVDFLRLLTLAFNALLIYSLFANKDSVTSTLWTLLLVRELFGFLYFLMVYVRKWLFNFSHSQYHDIDQVFNVSFWTFFLYFMLLFAFGLAELVIMTQGDNASARTTVNLPLPVFAWFFLVIDWVVIFSVYVTGILVYEPSSLMNISWAADDNEQDYNDENDHDNAKFVP